MCGPFRETKRLFGCHAWLGVNLRQFNPLWLRHRRKSAREIPRHPRAFMQRQLHVFLNCLIKDRRQVQLQDIAGNHHQHIWHSKSVKGLPCEIMFGTPSAVFPITPQVTFAPRQHSFQHNDIAIGATIRNKALGRMSGFSRTTIKTPKLEPITAYNVKAAAEHVSLRLPAVQNLGDQQQATPGRFPSQICFFLVHCQCRTQNSRMGVIGMSSISKRPAMVHLHQSGP